MDSAGDADRSVTPQIMWEPNAGNKTKMDQLREHVNLTYNINLKSFKDFHQWSCDNYSEFWEEVFKFTEVIHSIPYDLVIDKQKKISDIPEWFPGCHLNYAENLLRYNDDRVAIYATGEGLGVTQKTFRELRESVARYASALKKIGVQKGDRVVGYIPNCCEAIEAMLAASSIGAVWSSTSPDFGVQGVLDRFTQIRPKVIFSVNAVWYNGKVHNHLDKLLHVVQGLSDLENVVIIPFVPDAPCDISNIKNSILVTDFLPSEDKVLELKFEQVPFNHPLFIMYSSGTTGAPKCMVHSVGGTLLKHLEEHVIQSNMDRDDIMLYYTTVGWMMWNWLVSALAVGSAIVLYDGSPLVPRDTIMWDLIDQLGITFLGTSAKWISVMEDRGLKPGKTHKLDSLKAILSTGSPLKPQSYDYVYREIKKDILLASISDLTYWAPLPGLPAKVMWPVKIEKWLSDDMTLVYSNADDAYLKVKAARLIPYKAQSDIKEKSIAILKKKKLVKTAEELVTDIEWINGLIESFKKLAGQGQEAEVIEELVVEVTEGQKVPDTKTTSNRIHDDSRPSKSKNQAKKRKKPKKGQGQEAEVNEGQGQDAEVKEGQGQEAEVNEGQGQEAEVNEGQGQEAEVNEGQGQDAEVKEGQGQEAEVNEGQGQDTEVTEGQGQDAEVKEGQGQEAEVNEGQAQEAELKEGQGQEAEVNEGQGQEAEVNEGQGHDAESKEGQGQEAEVNEGQGQEAEVNEGQGQEAEVNEGQGQDAEVNEGQKVTETQTASNRIHDDSRPSKSRKQAKKRKKPKKYHSPDEYSSNQSNIHPVVKKRRQREAGVIEGKEAEVNEGQGQEAEVNEGQGQDAEVKEGQGQEAEVNEGQGQEAEMLEGQGQEAEVLEGQGQEAEVLEGQGQEAEVLEGQGQDTEVTEGQKVTETQTASNRIHDDSVSKKRVKKRKKSKKYSSDQSEFEYSSDYIHPVVKKPTTNSRYQHRQKEAKHVPVIEMDLSDSDEYISDSKSDEYSSDYIHPVVKKPTTKSRYQHRQKEAKHVPVIEMDLSDSDEYIPDSKSDEYSSDYIHPVVKKPTTKSRYQHRQKEAKHVPVIEMDLSDSDEYIPDSKSDEYSSDSSVYDQPEVKKKVKDRQRGKESESMLDLSSDSNNSQINESEICDGRKECMLSENEMERDKNSPEIYARKVLTSKISKFGKLKKRETVWNQAHYCTFCRKIVTNFTKHLKLKHKKEKVVMEVIQAGETLGKRSKKVMGMWNSLRSEMDHENNMRVVKEGKGEIIVARRKSGMFDIKKYGPCPNCSIWIQLDKTFLRHQSTCPSKNESNIYQSSRELKIASLMKAGRLNTKASDALKREVFCIMTPDAIGKVAMNDQLIIMLGNMWLTKNVGNKLKRKYYTSSRMRDAARMLINLKEISGVEENMLHFIQPKYFDCVVKAALKTASPDIDDVEDLKSPSTAIKLGYDVKRMTNAKLGMAIKNNLPEDREKCLDFMKLMDMEWSLNVNRLATITLQTRRFNKEKMLPDPDDLVDLTNSVKKEIKDLNFPEMTKSPDVASFRKAVQLAQTRLLLFNKRRGGEIEGISVKQYVSRKCGVTSIDKAMRADLTEVEQKLLETQEVLETRGKYGRGVPVIIPRDCKEVLSFIADATVRKAVGIKDENMYLFPNSNIGVVRSYDSLKNLSLQLNLKRPEQITSVNLRKYTATISQVLDLSPQEQSWLVNHLGHGLDIHKIHYRQTSSTIERIDISKMMLLQEFNLASKYSNKKLKDIDLKELMVDSEGNVTLKDLHKPEENDDRGDTNILTDNEGYIPENFPADEEKDEFAFEDDDEILAIGKEKKKRGNSTETRKMWSAAEEEEIKMYFKEHFKTHVIPGKTVIEEAIKKRGTDIIACFMGQNWTVPVYRGEVQGPTLGCAIEARDEEGKPVYDEPGELVCTKPFPSMPVFFWNDEDGKKYKKAYFEMYPDVWAHGDHCCISSYTGGIVMLGRSDGVLNPNGVRFGSAEIYNVVESFKEIQDSVCVAQRKKDNSEERVVLFVKMATGSTFSPDLVTRIKTCIRNELSARYMPAVVLQIDDIPYTINGKKVEVAVRKAMKGEEVVQKGALGNPQCLQLYHNIKELEDY